MEILINELSLHEQYPSDNEFIDSLIDTIRLYNVLLHQGIKILKKSDIWSYRPTKNNTLRDILVLKGNDKITRFKSVLANLINEKPFWDTAQVHRSEDEYLCSCIPGKSNNSIAEACERDQLILSFKSPLFLDNQILVCKNSITQFKIQNFFSKHTFLDYLIDISPKHFIYFCKNRFENYKVDFVKIDDKYPIEDILTRTDDQERNNIINEIKKLVLVYLDRNEIPPQNISKNLENNILELRISFKERICRLLYFYGPKNTIVFTHGFIKKTQKTPDREKKKADLLKRKYQSARLTELS